MTVAFAVQHQLSYRGLATLGNAAGPFAETLIVDGAPGAIGELVRTTAGDPVSWPRTLGRVMQWSLPARFAETPVETVSLADAESLREALVRWIGGSARQADLPPEATVHRRVAAVLTYLRAADRDLPRSG